MIVRIFKTDLNRIMINITYLKFGFYPWYIHGLKLQICHCARGILCERLIDADADFFAGYKVAVNQMPS